MFDKETDTDKHAETDQAVWFQFLQVAQKMLRSASGVIQAHGITPPQYLLMRTLCQFDDLKQQDLADRLMVTKGNISQMLKIMERDQMVTREAGDGGNRVLLTEQATALYQMVEKDHEALVERIYGVLTADEQAQLLALLHKLNGVLDSDDEATEPNMGGDEGC